LERWLQEQPAVVQGQLTFHVCWLPPNASWLDQLEIWFSILQRKLLQPNHFVSIQDLEQAIHNLCAGSCSLVPMLRSVDHLRLCMLWRV
jgi:hypothetical protein